MPMLLMSSTWIQVNRTLTTSETFGFRRLRSIGKGTDVWCGMVVSYGHPKIPSNVPCHRVCF